MVEYIHTVKKGKQMYKFENIAKTGETIRGYDFKPMVGRNDCYVEGKVVEINPKEVPYACFKVKCTKDVFDGVEHTETKGSRVGKTVFIPMEVSFMEFDARIINLSK